MKSLLTSLFVLTVFSAFSQSKNINWTFSSKKIADKTYEIHMTAKLAPQWHVYSQKQPADAIALPTVIAFNKNPLVTAQGGIKEVGKLIKFTDKKLGLSANQYSNTVDFVQVFKVKGEVKTSVGGKVEFQICDDEKCLPPDSVPFNISLK